MPKRFSPPKGQSVSKFRKDASRTKLVNVANPPRGGIRL